MANKFHSFKPYLQDGNNPSKTQADGYTIVDSVGGTVNTQWIDLHSAEFVSVTVVFTGGTPNGTIQLRQSNDRQSAASQGVYPASASSPSGQPLDAANVTATITGTASQTVAASGTYVLNQFLVPYRWLQVQWTSNTVSSTTLDIFVHWKSA